MKTEDILNIIRNLKKWIGILKAIAITILVLKVLAKASYIYLTESNPKKRKRMLKRI